MVARINPTVAGEADADLFSYAERQAARSVRICTVAGCPNNSARSNGLCHKHNYRQKRHGTTDLQPRPRRPLEERFQSYVLREPNSGCWLWTGAIDRRGYGVLNVNGVVQRAHRLGYKLYRGEIPSSDVFVCHRCDTESCCNPDHMFLGFALDNSQDCVKKDRNARGERSGFHVLTDEQVLAIRAAYQPGVCSYKMLGRQYGVDHTAIYKIVRNKRWRHLIPC